ncbi:MAG: AAA family ATPase, partial [Stellaceae bacterium]
MRLTSFTLENYGNFRQVALSLDPGPGRINLVVAPNGAGKTVLRTAFRDWLFSIPGQTRMGFRFGYPGMRLFAEGIDGNGNAFAIGRRKGAGNTLIDAHGNSIDPRVFDRLVGDADEALFKRLFALDTDLLRDGVKTMIENGGELAEARFAAGSGIAGMRRLREGLEASRDDRAPARRAGSRPLYQALDHLAVAQADLRKATVRPQAWAELSGQLAFAREQLERLARSKSDQQREITLLERIRRVRPWLEQREAACRECLETAGAPQLSPDTAERWRKSAAALVLVEQEVNAASGELLRIEEAIAAEQPDDVVLENGERIDALDRRREQITADLRDLPRREAERTDA